MSTGNTTTFYAPEEQPLSEPTVVRLRRHGRILLLPTIALVVLGVVAGMFVNGFSEWWITMIFWIVIALGVVLLWLLPLITWLGNRVILTSRRVIIYRGVFVRSRQEIMLSRIYDLTVRQNAVQAVFGAGDLLLNTGAEVPIRLHDLPKANLVLSAMNELVEKQIPLSAQLRKDSQRWTGEI